MCVYVYISVATNSCLIEYSTNIFVRIFVRSWIFFFFPKVFEYFSRYSNIFVSVRSRFLKNLKYSNSFDFFFFKVEIFVFVRISMVIFASVREYDKYSKTFQTSIRSGKIYYIRSNSIRIVFDRIVSNSTRECLVHSNSIQQNLRRGVPANRTRFVRVYGLVTPLSPVTVPVG